MAAGSVHFGDYRLDAPNAQLWRGQQQVKLSPKALSVLDYLASRPGQLVSKDELFSAVWPEVVVSEGTLTECVREVRRALGETARAPRFIETVHRRGYRFIGQVKETAVSSVSSSPPLPARLVVGREAELAQLRGWYTQARHGQRHVVFVAGEAGIGKTTLVEACVERLQDDGNCWVGHGQCIEQYGAGEAYMPILEALGRLCRGPDGQQFVELLGQHAPTWLVQMPTLLPAEELEALQRKTAGATQQRMLREMAEALEALTVEQPLVLVLEDLHWSDYSTVELLAALARRREAARLLVLGTHRIVEVNLGEHHLKKVKQELQVHGQCEELALDFLSEGAVGDYLTRRFGQGALATLPASLPGFIHRHTDGNPLFVVRVTEDLVQREILTEHDGQWELSAGLSEESVHVPEGLRQFIEQQFAQLSHTERRLVEAASVAGVEFSAAAVAAGIQQTVEEVEIECAGLAQRQHFLVDKGVAEWPDGTVAARYGFIHALYQEVFYARLTPGRRSGLHLRIGQRAETAYGARADEIAVELALHFEQGRDLSRAIQYLQQAGQRAARRLAGTEAISHLTKGLTLLQALPNSAERTEQELDLQLQLGGIFTNFKGFGAQGTEDAYLRAHKLCLMLGGSPRLSSVLYGLWGVALNRAELPKARELTAQLLHLAKRPEDPFSLAWAHIAMEITLFYSAEFVHVLSHADHVLALYDPEQDDPRVSGSPDPKVAALCLYASVAEWSLGYPDRAVQRTHAGCTLAAEVSHPFSLSWAQLGASWVHLARHEGQAAQGLAEAAIALSSEHGFPDWLAWGTIFRGAALAEQGQFEEGLEQMRWGLDAFKSTGTCVSSTWFLVLLTEAYRRSGQWQEGMAVLAEALAFIERTGERFYEAELYRLKGELSLQAEVESRKPVLSAVVGAQVEEEAEDCFQKAIEISRRQQAKSLELRAAMSLSRLWQQQGKTAEARELLAPVYGWFTEGFDTADLKDAKALLEQLS